MLKELDCEAFMQQKEDFALLIDARSPKEFLHSHIPGAENYYALNNAEHEEVGTLYMQVSRNDAKALGAQYICINASSHIKEIYKAHKIGARIGIYCAKGGLRSSALALILSSMGYQVFKLYSGYKSYRNFVLNYLEDIPHQHFIVLGGNTGCGKTELLAHLSPSIDLEALAAHMGSSFGSVKGKQPSQKMFENTLVHLLSSISPKSRIFIEGESKRMGNVTIPTSLHVKMREGKRIEITAPLKMRVMQILKDYEHISPAFFYESMGKISPYIKKNAKEEIIDAFERHDLNTVSTILLVEYYDNVYRKPEKVDAIIDNSNMESALKSLKTFSNTH